MSEQDGEVLSSLRLPDSFPSAAFRSFDHQGKTNFFCCLGAKDKQTSLEIETVSAVTRLMRRFWLLPPALQDLRLPPSLHLHLSRSQRCRWALGWRSFAPPGDCVPPTPPSDLEGHRENRSLPKEPRQNRASSHHSGSGPGLRVNRSQTAHSPQFPTVRFHFLKD